MPFFPADLKVRQAFKDTELCSYARVQPLEFPRGVILERHLKTEGVLSDASSPREETHELHSRHL